nr:ribonuclease H-like domain-containing protein [Tanacetum cinerariifolium]
ITGKGTIKTGKLEFENVYFVKDLKYNMFSLSQICDNKNSVLFTDSECIVLGRDFKLLDDANILLRTPRQHNMYAIDLNNIVPHKDLTCSVAKASADECMLWHRRLGHLNFKTMNKLVRCDNRGEFRNKEINDFCSQKGIKREFSNDRNPPQNGVAERRNRTLIEVARTMLADAKLPVTIWAEAVNTGCYVQNRVLVNKSHNKTPYELFNGRSSAIGFLKPFGCHVMILNTLDNLGKFEEKGDEGYFIRYSMSSKAFRVFNKRTRRVEENLHVEFLENKAFEKGAGPNWLFNIDFLTKSMNYVPVDAGIISTNISGTKDATSQEVKKNVSSLRYIALPNWTHDALLESSSSKPKYYCSTKVPESSGNTNPTASTSNPPADQMETLTVESLIPIISSPVLTAYSTDFQEPSSDARLISKRVAYQVETPSLDNILTLTNRFEDILRVTTNLDESNGVGTIDQTLFIRRQRGYFILVQVYVDDINFGSLNPQLCREFKALMHKNFQMSAMGELNFFLYYKFYRRRMTFFSLKTDRKSTTGGYQFLGRRLISWQCKNQTIVATSTTEAEYVTVASCCGQVLGIQNQLLDYGEHNIDFHPMVDFVEASPLRIETTEEGTKILTTVDGILKTITESSLRRNLKLQDEEGISSLPDMELFENLTLMGYNISLNQKFTFQKGRIVPLFATMLVPQGEGSGTPTKPHHTPSPEAQQPSHTIHSSPTIPFVSTVFIPPVTSFDTPPIRQYTGRTRITQSSVLPPVADKPASLLRDVSQGEACPTDSGFLADQDRATIAKSSTLPHDSAPRVTSLTAAEGTHELEITRLKARVKLLEDRDGVAAEGSGDDAPIKGRNLDEGEATAKRVSDDTEEMATVLTSMDAATVLASGAAEVPTGSGSIPTAGPPAAEVPTSSDVVPTASPVFATATVVTPYRRRKGKEVMVESETLMKQKVQEQINALVAKELEEQLEREDQRMSKQIARHAKVARIHVEEELQSMIDGLNRSNETVAKYQDNYAKVYKFQTQQRNPWSKKQKRDYYMAVIRSNLGWKEEAERLKRKGLSLQQESAKNFKPSDEVLEEVKSPNEVPKEKVKEMMQLVPIEEVYIESLQVKHPIIDWMVHTEGQRSYWKIIRLGGIEWKLYDMCGVHQVTSKDKEIFMLVEKECPLRKGLTLGRIVKNKMHKAFPLLVIKFPLAEEVPTASEESSHCQKKKDATAMRIAWLVKVKE